MHSRITTSVNAAEHLAAELADHAAVAARTRESMTDAFASLVAACADALRSGHKLLLFGNGGADILFGGDDNDALYGGTGNDQLFGGNGADVMFIDDGSGIDSVSGFANGVDRFDFTLHAGVTNFSQLTISTLGGDALVDFTGGQLFIAGAAGLLDATDFVFA